MNKRNFWSGISELLDENAPTIATFASVLGVIATAFFMHRGAEDAAKAEKEYAEDVKRIQEEYADDNKRAKEEIAHARITKRLKLIYIYRWAIVSGIVSGGCSIASNAMNGRKIAGFLTGAVLGQDQIKNQFKKMEAKVKDMFGEEKLNEIKDGVHKELLGEKISSGDLKVDKSKKQIKVPEGDPDGEYTRYYLPGTDEFWDIQEGVLKNAIDEASREKYLSWSTFRNMCGYGSCGWNQGWDRGNPFKAHIGYVNIGIVGMKALIFDNAPRSTEGQRWAELKERIGIQKLNEIFSSGVVRLKDHD